MNIRYPLITAEEAEALADGSLTQSKLAAERGVNQTAISRFLRKHYPDKAIGRGGVKPMSEEMAMAVEEALPEGVNIAKVASKYKVEYLPLARRVKTRRDRIASERKSIEKSEPLPVDADELQRAQALIRHILTDPTKTIRLAHLAQALLTT